MTNTEEILIKNKIQIPITNTYEILLHLPITHQLRIQTKRMYFSQIMTNTEEILITNTPPTKHQLGIQIMTYTEEILI